MNEVTFRRVHDSQTVLKELMVPSYANFGGKVHGGIILSLMDKIAYTCAASHAKGYCVTASVDSVDFLNSVEVGALLTLSASVNYVGKSSMEIGIRVESEDFTNSQVKHTNTSYFTMVALDQKTRKPMLIPGLVLEGEEQIRRFIEGKIRREVKRGQRQEMSRIKSGLDMIKEIKQLEGENCKLYTS